MSDGKLVAILTTRTYFYVETIPLLPPGPPQNRAAIDTTNKSAVVTQAKVDQMVKRTDDVHAMLRRSIENTSIKSTPISEQIHGSPIVKQQ